MKVTRSSAWKRLVNGTDQELTRAGRTALWQLERTGWDALSGQVQAHPDEPDVYLMSVGGRRFGVSFRRNGPTVELLQIWHRDA